MIKKYLPAVFLSIAFVSLLLFLNTRNSLNFVEEQKIIPTITPVPTETQWQTYRNEKYGFEFQYPSGLIVFGDNTSPQVSLGYEGTGGLFFQIDVNLNTNITKLFNSHVLKYDNDRPKNISEAVLKRYKLNSNTGQETTFIAAIAGADMRVVYLQKDNNVISISLPPNIGSSSEEILSTSNQILSTFKFKI